MNLSAPITFDCNQKKKRRRGEIKSKQILLPDYDDLAIPSIDNIEPNKWLKDDFKNKFERDYSYPELLKRLYDKCVMNNTIIDHSVVKKNMDPPTICKLGSIRVVWINFDDNCRSINRPHQHVCDFILSELGTTGSLGADNNMTIRARFQSRQIEDLLKKYIVEYVICNTCGSPETNFSKESRILFKICSMCNSSQSVNAIQCGFR